MRAASRGTIWARMVPLHCEDVQGGVSHSRLIRTPSVAFSPNRRGLMSRRAVSCTPMCGMHGNKPEITHRTGPLLRGNVPASLRFENCSRSVSASVRAQRRSPIGFQDVLAASRVLLSTQAHFRVTSHSVAPRDGRDPRALALSVSKAEIRLVFSSTPASAQEGTEGLALSRLSAQVKHSETRSRARGLRDSQ